MVGSPRMRWTAFLDIASPCIEKWRRLRDSEWLSKVLK
jgi:hypothetical protein